MSTRGSFYIEGTVYEEAEAQNNETNPRYGASSSPPQLLP